MALSAGYSVGDRPSRAVGPLVRPTNSQHQLSKTYARGYSLPMSDKLDALLERLKAHQRTLILTMAEHDGLPAGSALRQVAELENVIAAIEAVAAEEANRARPT